MADDHDAFGRTDLPRGDFDYGADAGWPQGSGDAGTGGVVGDPDGPGPTNGFWADADWLGCRDGRWRPVEPGTFPLVDGAAARVGRLRGYGNAIVAQVAEGFIRSFLEAEVEARSSATDLGPSSLMDLLE